MEDEDILNDDETILDQEEDELEVEAETEEPDQEFNPLKDMIDAIDAENYAQASDIFQDRLNDKLRDALETRKIALSNAIFNNGDQIDPDAEETEEEIESDEEI